MSSYEVKSGTELDLTNPQPDQFTLGDIYLGTSNACRFAGQIKPFYSVAEHQINCALMAIELGMSISEQVAIIFHDAAEAFLCDLPTPLKHMLPQYKIIETNLMHAICKKIDLNVFDYEESIHYVDFNMKILEKRRFRPKSGPWENEHLVEDRPVNFQCFLPYEAEYELRRLATRLLGSLKNERDAAKSSP